jgi:hypothetical protein
MILVIESGSMDPPLEKLGELDSEVQIQLELVWEEYELIR